MDVYQYTTEQLVERYEDLREIKNLMGKFSNYLLLKKENLIYQEYWSSRDDVCLGFNGGYYKGSRAVKQYYETKYAADTQKAKIMRELFPQVLGGKDDQEIHGVGTFEAKPLSNVLIEVADDRETAKGMWQVFGTDADITAYGPMSYWLWGYYAVDFIYEEGEWKIWHLLYVEDIHHLAGQDWTKPDEYGEPRGEFSAVQDIVLPEVNEKVCVRELYSPNRPFTKTPRIPEPYVTFSETFSYGI